jgi:hypothetical protein
LSDSGARGWTARIRSVGEAFLGVIRAEIAAVVADLGQSGRALARALLWLAAAMAVAFWTLGLLIYFAVELLALVVPRWGAVGIVLGLFVLVAALLGLAVKRKVSAIEPPDETVRRHLAGSQRWWRERVEVEDEIGAGEEIE